MVRNDEYNDPLLNDASTIIEQTALKKINNNNNNIRRLISISISNPNPNPNPKQSIQ